jgi:hypothetical protein
MIFAVISPYSVDRLDIFIIVGPSLGGLNPVSRVGGEERLERPAWGGGLHPKGRNEVEDASRARVAARRSGLRKERRPPCERDQASKMSSRSDGHIGSEEGFA